MSPPTDADPVSDGHHAAIPFLRPSPPRLSDLGAELAGIERSGIFTNYGPTNARFERALEERMFVDRGHCLTVCNATIGLMMAMRAVIGHDDAGSWSRRSPRRLPTGSA